MHTRVNGSARHRYIFLEYASPAHATDAVKSADGYKLDKQHTFRVNLFTDFDKWVQARAARPWAPPRRATRFWGPCPWPSGWFHSPVRPLQARSHP